MGVTKMFIFCGRHKFMTPRLYIPRNDVQYRTFIAMSYSIIRQSIKKSPFHYAEDVLVKNHVHISEFEKLDQFVCFLA